MSFHGDPDESGFKWHPTLIMTNIPHARQPQKFYSLYLNSLHGETRRVCWVLSSRVVLCSVMFLPCAIGWRTATITLALAWTATPTPLTLSASTICRQHVLEMRYLRAEACCLVSGLNWYPVRLTECCGMWWTSLQYLTWNLHDFIAPKPSLLPAEESQLFYSLLIRLLSHPLNHSGLPCSPSNPLHGTSEWRPGLPTELNASSNLHQGLGVKVPLPSSPGSFFKLRALSSVQAIAIDLVYSFKLLELPYISYPKLPQCSTSTTCSHVPKQRMLQNQSSVFHLTCLDGRKARSSSHQSLLMTFVLVLIITCFCESAISRRE